MLSKYATTPAEADRRRRVQGFSVPFRANGPHTQPELADVARLKHKALDLLEHYVLEQYQEIQIQAPAKGVIVAPGDSIWEQTVDLAEQYTVNRVRLRHDMAKELHKLRGWVRRTVKVDGISIRYRSSVGARELRKQAAHPALQRFSLCDMCYNMPREVGEKPPMACGHKSETQRWLRRFLHQVERTPYAHRWAIVYVVLMMRDVISHWNRNRQGIVDPRKIRDKDDPRGQREAERVDIYDAVVSVDDEGNEVHTDRLVGTVNVEVSDGASQLSTDLRGWDRPSSIGRRTQRLAFCGVCVLRDNPWFLVGRKVEFGSAKCTHIIDGAACNTVEIEPPPRKVSAKRPTYTVRRTRVAHRELLADVHVFYRAHGLWYAERDNVQTHKQLNHQLDRRWLAQFRRA